MIQFADKISEQWFNYVMENWSPKTNIIVFVPCASKKPYHSSITHKCFFKKLWNLWFTGKIDLVIVSEPLTVVPANFDYPIMKYPEYDYPPRIIKKNPVEQEIWRKRLNAFLNKHIKIRKYAILYKYHKEILGNILRKHNVYAIYTERPYITKSVHKLLKIMKRKENISYI